MAEGLEKPTAEDRRRRDAAAVAMARQGDETAFDGLVRRYFGMVYSLSLAHLHDNGAAEDLTQEVFLRAYLNLGKLNNPEHFSAWITQMTRNLAIDWIRSGQSVSRLAQWVELTEAAELPETRMVDAREAAAIAERDRRVHEAIGRLTLPQREIVMLHFAGELTKAEIAERIGVHPSTVGRHITTALAALKGLLTAERELVR